MTAVTQGKHLLLFCFELFHSFFWIFFFFLPRCLTLWLSISLAFQEKTLHMDITRWSTPKSD